MEAMDSDPVDIVFDLRTELHELVDDLRELKFGGVDEFTRFLEAARDDEAQAQIPKLRKMKDRIQLLKTRLIEKSRTSSFAPLRGDMRHMPSSSPAKSRLIFAPSPMGSAPLQGDMPSSSPAPHPEALNDHSGLLTKSPHQLPKRLTAHLQAWPLFSMTICSAAETWP
jgi:hypothetical protein